MPHRPEDSSTKSPLLPLQGARVVELCGGIAGTFAGRWLALLGAEVVKVEPPGGDPMRRVEPLFVDLDGVSHSTLFEFLNGGKRSVELAVDEANGKASLDALLRTADVLIHDRQPGDSLARSFVGPDGEPVIPGLIVTGVLAFGAGAGYEGWRAADITGYGMGGMMYITGAADREPLKHGLTQAEFAAGEHAVIGVLTALVERTRSGVGQYVESTMLEAVASLIFVQTAQYSYTGEVLRRQPLGGSGIGALQVMRTKDGYIAPVLGAGGAWSDLVSVLGDERLGAPEFSTPLGRREHAARLDPMVEAAMARIESKQLFQEAQRHRLAFGLCQDAAQLLDCEQHRARGFFRPVSVGGRTLQMPGLPFIVAGQRGAVLGAAPAAGVDQSLLPAVVPSVPPVTRGTRRAALASASGVQALEGVKVLEAGMMYAAPMAARILADFGADVVKVESAKRLDGIRSLGSPPDNELTDHYYDECSRFNDSNRNKRAISLDITSEEGKSLFLQMAAKSDIVIENFTTGVVDRLGIGFEAVRAVNPRIIYISTTGYGQDGPWSRYRAQGQSLEPAFGLAHLTGYADGEPMRCGMTYSDVTAARAGAIAMLSALLLRDRTDDAVYVDLSQYEEGTGLVAEALMEFQLTGKVPGRRGNRDARNVPQGAYPCAGDDEWVTVAVQNDSEWTALARQIGDTRLLDPSLSQVEGRRAKHDLIDEAITDWTRGRTKQEAASALQSSGVPAGPVNRPDEVLLDVHLRSRGFFHEINHRDGGRLGQRWYTGPAARLSRTPARINRPAPAFAEHTQDVLAELGLAADDVARLTASGVASSEPDRAELRAMLIPDQKRQIATKALQRWDADFRERITDFFIGPHAQD